MSDFGVNDNHEVYYTGNYWNNYPECLSEINKRLFNKDIDWKLFLKNKNIHNFDSALILNCGNGWVEREMYDMGFFKKCTAIEYSQELVDECNEKKQHRNINYICCDTNKIDFEENSFDLVINYAAGHHIRFIEKVWFNITKWLKPNGYFIHNDYVGPQRNQYTQNQWEKMEQTNALIDNKYKKRLGYPDIQQMMAEDPTEAIHSDKIVSLTYKYFSINYHRKAGGVIAYELLTHNDELYSLDVNKREYIVKNILEIDQTYLNETGESFFDFIIAENDKDTNTIKKAYLEDELNMQLRENFSRKMYGSYSYNNLKVFEKIHCGDGNTWGNSLFVHGFSFFEQSGRWSHGDDSIIRFKIDPLERNLTLLVQLSPLSNGNNFVDFTVEVNEVKKYEYRINSRTLLEIPYFENSTCPNEMFIIFKYNNVKSPAQLNINSDSRPISLFFEWIELTSKQ